MKRAELPDGRALEFPPDTNDGEMDSVVHALMGVGKEEKPDVMPILLAEIQALRHSVENLANAMTAGGDISKNAALLVHAGIEQIVSTLKAPKTIVTDKDGKPTGLRVN